MTHDAAFRRPVIVIIVERTRRCSRCALSTARMGGRFTFQGCFLKLLSAEE